MSKLSNIELYNSTKNKKISSDLIIAKTFFERSKGLLGKKGLNKDQCLWIHSCKSIHTYFMKFNIDVIYVDKNLKIVRIHRNIPPWDLSWGGLKSDSCFEFQADGLCFETEIGDSLRVSA